MLVSSSSYEGFFSSLPAQCLIGLSNSEALKTCFVSLGYKGTLYGELGKAVEFFSRGVRFQRRGSGIEGQL